MRLAISMRVDLNPHNEPQDSLARSWGPLVQSALATTAILVPIANDPANITAVNSDEFDGFILSGGNDIGTVADRDAIEIAMIQTALRNNQPLLGVCRGLQMLQHYFGGTIDSDPDGRHCGQTHSIHPSAACPSALSNHFDRHVNSFHRYVIDSATLAEPLVAWALDECQHVEAAAANSGRIVGIMWHPERGPEHSDDIALLRRVFDPS